LFYVSVNGTQPKEVSMQITLSQFEAIDTCLLDACIDATSLSFTDDFASALECAAQIVSHGLLGLIEVVDEEAI